MFVRGRQTDRSGGANPVITSTNFLLIVHLSSPGEEKISSLQKTPLIANMAGNMVGPGLVVEDEQFSTTEITIFVHLDDLMNASLQFIPRCCLFC